MTLEFNLISVIIPCYNSSRTILRTIRSVLDQTFQNFEIIIVDDGSTDTTINLVESLSHVKIAIIKQENSGSASARNAGVKKSNGKYLFFLDSDDIIMPQSFDLLVTAIKDKPNYLACMGCEWFIEDQNVLGHVSKPPNEFFPEIISQNIAPIHSWLIPKINFMQVGGFCNNLTYYEDWDLWFQVGLNCSGIIPVDYIGSVYFEHSGQKSTTKDKQALIMSHCLLQARFIDSFLMNREILKDFAIELFWSSWNAYNKGVKIGLDQKKEFIIAGRIEYLVKTTPTLRKLKFAYLIYLIGIKYANKIRNLLT